MQVKETPKRVVISLLCLAFAGCAEKSVQDRSSSPPAVPKPEPSPVASSQAKYDPLCYEIVVAEDQSHKALVKRLSDYTRQELVSLPTDKKMVYRVVVSPQITRNHVRPLVEKIIRDITAKDNGIDEIGLFLYSDREIVNGPYDVAGAIWAPYGALGNVTPQIALDNNRDNYQTTIQVREDLEEYLQKRNKSEEAFGLTETKRREIFKEIVAAEDRAQAEADRQCPISGPATVNLTRSQLSSQVSRNIELERQLDEQYKNELGKKYGLTRQQLKQISLEGVGENWPMPPMR